MSAKQFGQPEAVHVDYDEIFPESYRGVIIVDAKGSILHRIFEAGGVRDLELAEVWMKEHAQSPWIHGGDCDNFVEDAATDPAELLVARADARKNLGPFHIVVPVAPPGQPYAGFEVRRESGEKETVFTGNFDKDLAEAKMRRARYEIDDLPLRPDNFAVDHKDAGKSMYEMIWRNKNLTIEAISIDDMIKGLSRAAKTLAAMKKDGVVLSGGAEDDHAHLVTTDEKVAQKYGFDDEP